MSNLQEIIDEHLLKLKIDHHSFNEDDGIIECFNIDWKEFVHCKHLLIKNCSIISLYGINNLKNLRVVELRDVNLINYDFSHLQKLVDLKELHLSLLDNDDEDDIYSIIKINNVLNLDSVSIDANVDEIQLSNLEKLTSIAILDSYNYLEVDESIRKSVKYLSLKYPVNIPKFSNLKYFNIEHTEDELRIPTYYNLYKIEILMINNLSRDKVNIYRLGHFKRRINRSVKRLNYCLVKNKLREIWDKFLASQNGDGFNRLSYLAYYL